MKPVTSALIWFQAMTSIDRRFEPDPAAEAIYDDVFDAYVGLYPAIAPVLRRAEPAEAIPV